MKYAHIIAEVLKAPWAILDAKFDAIVNVLSMHEAGERFSEDEIRARVGERKHPREPFMVAASGERVNYEAARGNGTRPLGKMAAVIPVYGVIMPRAADFDISTSGTSVESLTKQFRSALANPDVNCIVLDFDSPGGSVYGIDELASEIFAARDQKKIVAQVNPLAASAAYYLASQASEIAITPSGEAGSIGVRAMHQDLSKALELKGIKITHISAGKYKTEGAPTEPLGEEARAFMQQRVDEYYDMFVAAVSRGRDVKKSEVKNGFGEGRVLGATEAKKLGMVDRIATLDETLSRLGVSSTPVNSSALAPEQYMGDPAGQKPASANSNTAEAESTEVTMDETQTTTAAAAAQTRAVVAAEAERCSRIMQLAQSHNLMSKASAWIEGNKSVQDVQAEILTSLSRDARPVSTPAAEDIDRGISVIRDEGDKVEKGVRAARFVRAFAASKGNRTLAAQISERVFGDKLVAGYFATDVNNSSTLEAGGALVPEAFMPEVIELLRPMAVVRSLNPELWPLINGSLTAPKITDAPLAQYKGETKPLFVGKSKFGQVKATGKELGTLVPLSNSLLRRASVAADVATRNEMTRTLKLVEDVVFIRSQGSAYTPKGLRYWAGNVLAATAAGQNETASDKFARINGDLGRLELALRDNNVAFLRPGWIISPRTEYYLKYQHLNGVGVAPYKDEMTKDGTINGYPYRVTTQIPKNLGNGGNETEIYFADFADVVIADAPTIGLEISTEATYVDGDGTTVSAFQNDLTLVRMIVEHDMVARHAESIVVMTGVTWGA